MRINEYDEEISELKVINFQLVPFFRTKIDFQRTCRQASLVYKFTCDRCACALYTPEQPNMLAEVLEHNPF